MYRLVFWSVIMLSLALAAAAFGQEDMRVVSNSDFINPQRPPALFPHDSHNEKAGIDDCAVCHHVFDDAGHKLDDESSEDQACADCHALRRDGEIPGLREAFHARCKGCHLAEDKGPITCAQCHAR